MKNIFRLSVVLLVATLAVGCSQNEELEATAPAQGNSLAVTATANDFESAEPETRGTESEYTTTFESGDQIGVYAISKADGKVFIKNRPLKKGDDGKWTGNAIYYYKNTDYIAYFPYTDKLSTQTIASEEDIAAYFKNQLTKDQGTKEAYYTCDVMSAKIEAANITESGNLDFGFAHKLSMIEVKLPVRDYKTSDAEDAYEYYVPVDLTLTIDNEDYTAYAIDKGVYRCIVAPTAEGAKLSVAGSFFDIDAPVTFSKSDITLATGNYQKLNVTYTYEGYNPIRPLQVGDYYYADGNIYPGDLANPPAAGCVGVVFATEGVNVTDGTKTWNHGYVLALNDANESSCKWSNLTSDIADVPSYATERKTSSGNVNDENVAVLKSMFADKNGYSITQAVKALTDYNESQYPAFYAALNYGEVKNTSGWHLPTMGQMADMMNAFAMRAQSTYRYGPTENDRGTVWNTPAGDAPTVAAMLNLYNQLIAVGGTWNIAKPDIAGDTSKGLRWWVAAEHSDNNAWCIDLNCKKFVALVRPGNVTANKTFVRPVLAF